MNMKRIGIIAMALTLVLGLSQCKKEQPTTANEGDTVSITLDIRNNSGTRMDVNTGTGTVTYETGDVIYVASGGTFIGTLTHNGTNFGGTITNPIVGEPLHFYFLGNVTPSENLTSGVTTSCSVVISDQTEHLPVIEYAPSNESYTAGATTFTAHLLNKCALVRFDVTTLSTAATSITGFNNKVTIDFSTNAFGYSQEGEGVITLPIGNGERWAILLPQEALEFGEVGSAYSEDGTYIGGRSAVPAIYENGYFTMGIPVEITNEIYPGTIAPIGAVNGKFTINGNGDQVYFSQGNLQFQASNNNWRFAVNQWNSIGNANSNISETYTGWIDLFGWGTSGYSHGAICYQPWSTSLNPGDYNVYGNVYYNLYDQTGQADWGYNAIVNGGNQENGGWHTLTTEEWYYVIYQRTDADSKYGLGKVNGVNGMILLPDVWTLPWGLNFIPGSTKWGNVYTITQWSQMEAKGAVFLPAAGSRTGTSLYEMGSCGRYWSGSCYGDFDAESMAFSGNYSYVVAQSVADRVLGYSVRLVRNAE